jgi:hypothetical protein
MTHQWRRTQTIESGWRELHAEDWSLVDSETGGVLARIFDTGDNHLLGDWRWWVWPFHEIDNIGSAQTGADAKRLAEERLERLEAEDNPR